MKFFILIALASALLIGCGRPSAERPRVTGVAVINGTLAQQTDAVARSTALVISYNRALQDLRLCSSSLITPDLLVTAAHCLVDLNGVRLPPSYQTYVLFRTSVATHSPDFLKDAIAIPAAWAIPHDSYHQTDPSLANDIALIRLPRSAPADKTPVALLKDLSVLRPGVTVVLAGFGLSTPNGDIEKSTGDYFLRWMTTPILPYDSTMPGIVKVAGTPERRTADGDSGGPGLIVIEKTPYVFGVDSAGNDSDTCYTNLLSQLDWLHATARALGASANF